MASPSSFARRAQSRIEFAKLGSVEWPTHQVPGAVLGTEIDFRGFTRFFNPVFLTDNRPFPNRLFG